MADCSDNIKKRGSSNPIQSKIVENDHSSGEGSTGNNIIEGVTCEASVAIGNIVRMNGAIAINAIADTTTNSKAIGICVAKESPTRCTIQVTGFTGAVLSGLTTNENYFLSEVTPGALTTSAPTGSGEIVLHVGRAFSPTELVIQIGTQIRRS